MDNIATDAEIGIVGGIMINSDCIPIVRDLVTPEMFSADIHRKIFEALLSLDEAGKGIRPITIIDEMKKRGSYVSDLNKIIIDISGRVFSSAGVEDYCNIVREKFTLRRLASLSADISAKSVSEDADAGKVLEDAEMGIFKISNQLFSANGYEQIGSIVRKSMSSVEQIRNTKHVRSGIHTQFEKFNELSGGFHNGELVIVAGRPGTGKTAISLNIAQHLAIDQNRSVGFFSLEMSKDQLVLRLLSCEAQVNARRLRDGNISDRHIPSIESAIHILEDSNIYIEDTAYLSLKDLRAMARQMKSRHSIDILIVDYLQLVSVPRSKTINNREQEIANISKSLKALAKELNIPVLALSQLSRQTELRESRRPQLSDLRESGALEQDCDVAILLYRPGVYTESGDKQGFAEMIIGKQRNGPTGSVFLTFTDRQTRFDELPVNNLSEPPIERSLFNGR